MSAYFFIYNFADIFLSYHGSMKMLPAYCNQNI